MSSHMFGNEKYGSYVDQDGHIVVSSKSKNSTVEYCPENGRASYRREY